MAMTEIEVYQTIIIAAVKTVSKTSISGASTIWVGRILAASTKRNKMKTFAQIENEELVQLIYRKLEYF